MASYQSIARPYAKAAFLYAKEKHLSDQWLKALVLAGELVCEPLVKQVLNHPKLSAKDVSEIVIALLGKHINKPEQNFIRLVGEKRRLCALPDIARLFKTYLDASKEKVAVLLTTTVKMDKTLESALIQALHKRVGKNIELECQIDPDLIGGARIKIGDHVIDGSLRGQLQQMKQQMAS